ncbi:acyltransferase [Siphonobacter sp. BAB-5405]|uniref:acyltransferase family protein n=1 Tax=Siphonobacter sp. BAB-5405 TaxID=1864825 RepID=UPI000C806CD4|nr:acyltransferase [Siphonobacter sp. BAB-5405]PMD97002.1 acyltransferase [Siphonobacter sp. BAB-5405]
MSPFNSIFALSSLGIVLGILLLIQRSSVLVPAQVKYVTIEGLRGYLAFFVFLHHATFWYVYLHTGKWAVPDSDLYIQLGKISVVVFFMITGFLFFLKLSESREKPIHWPAFFVSRFFRLAPLYVFTMLVMIGIVAVRSDFTLRESPSLIATEIIQWLGFSIYGIPNINGVENTFLITAGVTWSLVYEWLFYFSLPLIGIVFYRTRVNPVLFFILLGIVVSIFYNNLIFNYYLLTFLAGGLAVYLIRIPRLVALASSQPASFVILGCLTLLVYPFKGNDSMEIVCTTIVFTSIAAGNSLWGILKATTSRLLGQVTYSIYLLHGIVLYTVFMFVIGEEKAQQLGVIEFWLVVIGASILLIAVSFLSYRYIEQPGTRVAAKINGRFFLSAKNGKSTDV